MFVIGFNLTIGANQSGKIDIGYITGVKYIKAVVKTEYKCMISLNFTVTAAKINPTPKHKITSKIKGIGTNKTLQCSSALVATITNSNAVNDAIRLIKLENTLDTTNKYLGIYIFLISDELLMIADMELVVESEKKVKITCPLNKYNGKFSTSNLNKFEKTTDKTIIMNNGFNSVQSTPKTERLYLIFMSLAISS